MTRRGIVMAALWVLTLPLWAQSGEAEIKFDKVSHDFGVFYESNPVVECTFHFTNVGDGLLVIHQAIASCGCTVPTFPKEPIKPGEGGDIRITYNGTGKYPGHFKKTVSIRTNGKVELTRLLVEGDMMPGNRGANQE